MLLAVAGMVGTVSAENVTIYLHPGTNWKTDNPRYALYMYNDSGNTWTDFVSVADHDGYYSATFDKDTYSKIIFCRMSPSDTENKWDNCYNQSWGIDSPSNRTIYFVNDDVWGDKNKNGDGYEQTTREMPANYYLYYGTNVDAAGGNRGEMIQDEYEFTYTIDNQTSAAIYYAMIVPSTAEESAGTIGSDNWYLVCFPNTNDGSDDNDQTKRLTIG